MHNDELSRKIPSVNSILEHQKVKDMLENYPKSILLKFIRQKLEYYKAHSKSNISKQSVSDEIVQELHSYISHFHQNGLNKVINATGIILHTNLGRAPLPKEALDAVQNTALGYSNLEYDIHTGQRGSRQKNIGELLTELTGAEDGFVVNNNAAAVFLVLNTFCKDKEVIVSRGEQVEIGGSFRIPEIIGQSGAKMVEVGTTNKTKIIDYEKAISENTGCILKVHRSNFKIVGFTEEPTHMELADLAKKNNLLLIEDQGNGNLIDLSQFGLPYEPTISDIVKEGFDLVLFSGDKLLGGPQAGIMAGKKELIEKINKNQLSRMLRVDKMTLAALEKILKIYLHKKYKEHIPIISMICRSNEDIEKDAENLAHMISKAAGESLEIDIIDSESQVGGGTLPEVEIPDKAIRIKSPKYSPNVLHEMLRVCNPPIIGRIFEENLLINLRTIQKSDYNIIEEKFKELFGD